MCGDLAECGVSTSLSPVTASMLSPLNFSLTHIAMLQYYVHLPNLASLKVHTMPFRTVQASIAMLDVQCTSPICIPASC